MVGRGHGACGACYKSEMVAWQSGGELPESEPCLADGLGERNKRSQNKGKRGERTGKIPKVGAVQNVPRKRGRLDLEQLSSLAAHRSEVEGQFVRERVTGRPRLSTMWGAPNVLQIALPGSYLAAVGEQISVYTVRSIMRISQRWNN